MDNATGRRSPGQNNSREELVVEEEEEEEDGEEERGGEDGLDDSSGNRQEFQLRRSDLPGDINGFKVRRNFLFIDLCSQCTSAAALNRRL